MHDSPRGIPAGTGRAEWRNRPSRHYGEAFIIGGGLTGMMGCQYEVLHKELRDSRDRDNDRLAHPGFVASRGRP